MSKFTLRVENFDLECPNCEQSVDKADRAFLNGQNIIVCFSCVPCDKSYTDVHEWHGRVTHEGAES